jgi:Na+:H+ antiporter, NhaA family
MSTRLRLPGHWTETPIARVLGPMQEFIHSSTSSGIVLLIAALTALIIANSPLREGYAGFLDTYIAIEVGPFRLRETLLHWINDGLMAIFFFQVGLEIKREIWAGELSSPRAALLPIMAAMGGALVPALIYTAINLGGGGLSGWSIPMATDIAFALGILALAGSRVPYALKIMLTAIAIIDDLIAVIIIALFYSGTLDLVALGVGFGFLGVLVVLNALGIRTIPVYVLLGVTVWVAFLLSGACAQPHRPGDLPAARPHAARPLRGER